jgi:hypothetical protein
MLLSTYNDVQKGDVSSVPSIFDGSVLSDIKQQAKIRCISIGFLQNSSNQPILATIEGIIKKAHCK